MLPNICAYLFQAGVHSTHVILECIQFWRAGETCSVVGSCSDDPLSATVPPLPCPCLQTAATPSTAEVLGGTGPSGAVATARGNFSTPSSGNGTALVTGLLPATNYTVS